MVVNNVRMVIHGVIIILIKLIILNVLKFLKIKNIVFHIK